jgi:hypothetical protein
MNLRKPPVLSEEAKARRNANLKPFKKGSSGNPTGRRRECGEVLHAAREHSLEAIETLVLVMRNGKPGEAMMAAQALLDRAWGRPKVTVDAEVQARAVGERTIERNIEILERRGLLDEFTAEEPGETMGAAPQ